MSEKRCGIVCALDWEEALIGEILAVCPEARPESVAAGLVICRQSPALLKADLVFARQWLPDICEGKGDSVRELITQIGTIVDPVLDESPSPWTWQFGTPDRFTLDGDGYARVGARAGLLEDKFRERMNTFRKRAMERYLPASPHRVSDAPGSRSRKAPLRARFMLQVLVTGRDRLWLSIGESWRSASGEVRPLPWTMPEEVVPPDPEAPCRSYYKLEEAWRYAGVEPRPTEVCVDLGAAPGGWTYSALKRGARVIAIDASDLAPNVASQKRCEHLRENGYEYQPSKPVDWLFCDMIVRPMATLGLLERWLQAGLCKHFVINVKFRGKDPSSILGAARDLAARYGVSRFLIRHLIYDRNEITLIGI